MEPDPFLPATIRFRALEVYSRNLKLAPPNKKSAWDHTLTEEEISSKTANTDTVKKVASDPKDEEGTLLRMS